MNSPRIILVAYQCGPGMGSVSQIGWEWYARLSAEYPVTLVTHIRNRDTLTAAGAPLHNSEVIFIDTEWFAGPLYRCARRIFPRSEHSIFLVSSLDYFVFDFAAYRRLKTYLDKTKNRDQLNSVLHRVTPVTVAAPTWLSHLNLPTVIGPLNSGLKDPRGFGQIMKQESTWLVRVRNLPRALDALIGSSRRAARILTATRSTQLSIAKRHHSLCQMMAENAVELSRFKPTPWPTRPDSNSPLRVLFVGRLIPIKGLDMLLRAIAVVRKENLNVELEIIGSGPMRDTWVNLRDQLGLSDCVRFGGARSLQEVAHAMNANHVLCLPSVRESGGAVLLEAMACARPVIALNFGGPAEIVDNTVGALLPMHNPEQVCADIAVTLKDIYTHPKQWQQRGFNGRARIRKPNIRGPRK